MYFFQPDLGYDHDTCRAPWSCVPLCLRMFAVPAWPFQEPEKEEIFERFESDAQWSVDFIVYLARILLNYDAASASWWQTEVVPAVDATLSPNGDAKTWQQMRAAKLREIFADYAASVEIGLRRYQEEGRRKSGLLKKLVDRYGETQEGRRQLALAFTLLEDQPLELLSSLLSSLQLESRRDTVAIR